MTNEIVIRGPVVSRNTFLRLMAISPAALLLACASSENDTPREIVSSDPTNTTIEDNHASKRASDFITTVRELISHDFQGKLAGNRLSQTTLEQLTKATSGEINPDYPDDVRIEASEFLESFNKFKATLVFDNTTCNLRRYIAGSLKLHTGSSIEEDELEKMAKTVFKIPPSARYLPADKSFDAAFSSQDGKYALVLRPSGEFYVYSVIPFPENSCGDSIPPPNI